MKIRSIAALCVISMLFGALAEHVRVKSFDVYQSFCFQWEVAPKDLDRKTPVVFQAVAASGTANLNFYRNASISRIGMTIDPHGKARVYDRSYNTLAILDRNGSVEYYVGHDEVVHSLADLAVFVMNQKYKRWTDAILPLEKEEVKK